MSNPFLDELNQSADLIDSGADDLMKALIYGPKGVGKTQLVVETGVYPIHIDSFDKGGTKHFKPEKDEGKLFADTRFEKAKAPVKRSSGDSKEYLRFDAWEKEINRRIKSNYFDNIGMYCMDSLSGLLDAVEEYLLASGNQYGHIIDDSVLNLKGFKLQVNMVKRSINMILDLPCHVIVNAHMENTQDTVTGEVLRQLAMFPSQRDKLPGQFDEYYALVTDPKGKLTNNEDKKKGDDDQVNRVLVTQQTRRYKGATRWGRNGLFSTYERPDLRYLIKKAGREVNHKELFPTK